MEYKFITVKDWIDLSGRRVSYLGDTIIVGDAVLTRVIYNNPATIALWSDGTKTVVKCAPGDTYSKEVGLILCVLKKMLGASNVKRMLKTYAPEDENVRVVEWKEV